MQSKAAQYVCKNSQFTLAGTVCLCVIWGKGCYSSQMQASHVPLPF